MLSSASIDWGVGASQLLVQKKRQKKYTFDVVRLEIFRTNRCSSYPCHRQQDLLYDFDLIGTPALEASRMRTGSPKSETFD